MKKFSVKNQDEPQLVELVGWSRSLPCYLNRQVIVLLSYLGIGDSVFLDLQRNQLANFGLQYQSNEKFFSTLKQFFSLEQFPGLKNEPFLKSLIQNIYLSEIRDIKFKSRLFVEKGKVLMGGADPTGTLEYGQAFIRVEGTLITGPVGKF